MFLHDYHLAREISTVRTLSLSACRLEQKVYVRCIIICCHCATMQLFDLKQEFQFFRVFEKCFSLPRSKCCNLIG